MQPGLSAHAGRNLTRQGRTKVEVIVRGFLSGLIWGGVVSAAGLGAVSQLAGPPGAASLPAEPAPVPAIAATGAAPDTAPETPAPAAETAPAPAAPDTSAPIAEAAPAADPATAAAAAAPEATDPLLDSAPAAAPPEVAEAAPAGLAGPAVPPDAPLGPEPLDTGTAAFDPTRIALPEAGDDAPGLADLPPPPPLTPEEEAMLAEMTKAAEEAEKAAREAGLVPVPAEVPEADIELDVAALPPGALPEPAPGSSPETAPEAAAAEAAAAKPQPGFSGAVDGVTTGRLPRIGAADTETAADPAPDAPAPDSPDLPPLTRYAAAFDGAAGKPLFAIVLVDPGGPDVDREALADLPLPVTIAIDPTAPDAALAAALYREAGKEVAMLATGIPAGATAGDLETTFESHAATLPEAVAVMDTDRGGFQNDRPLATQVVPVIAGQGRGLLTWDKGLNAGDQEARRADLASARIFRALDAGDEAAPVVRRYLDRAAFKAAQDGAVVVAGTVRPDTLRALAEWAIEGRAATVALAPLSAVLTRGR